MDRQKGRLEQLKGRLEQLKGRLDRLKGPLEQLKGLRVAPGLLVQPFRQAMPLQAMELQLPP